MLRWLFLLALQCVLIASWPVSPADDIDSLDSPTYLTHNLTRRQCVRRTAGVDNFECDFKLPTLVDIIARFRDPAYGGISSTTSAVFYTNLAYPEFAIKNVPHLRWIALWLVGTGRYSTAYSNFHNVDQIWMAKQLKWVEEHSQEFNREYPQFGGASAAIFFRCVYEALAKAAEHPDAYVFAPKNVPWRPDSVWAAFEFPLLTQNPKVKRIYHVDPRIRAESRDPNAPDNRCTADTPTLIWDRDRGDPIKPLAVGDCPIPANPAPSTGPRPWL